MYLDQISSGMVFKENDRRFHRWIRITAVLPNGVEFDSSSVGPEGPFDLVRRKSKKPERFHKEKRSSGYSLVGGELGNA